MAGVRVGAFALWGLCTHDNSILPSNYPKVSLTHSLATLQMKSPILTSHLHTNPVCASSKMGMGLGGLD